MAEFGEDHGVMNAGTVCSSVGEDGHVTIDVGSLKSYFENRMSQNLTISDKCCIFRVPHILKRHNDAAYVPNAFSIGPWHRNKPLMEDTEKVKLKYLEALLSQAPNGKIITLTELISTTGELEKEARECYAGTFNDDEETFVKILVLDACFLIELFRRYYNKKLRDQDDPIFHVSCMFECLHHDLILVENQIPWFVLESLFSKTVGPESEPLAKLALHFLSDNLSFTLPQTVLTPPKHLLDLLREGLVLPSELRQKDDDIEWENMPCASNLVDAGIKFKSSNTRCLLDIKFKDGVLEIPPLLVQETTEVIIRNLISYEQCYPRCPSRITSYAVLLDNLINTTKDMDILTRSGVIDNWLNPDDATQFFNRLYHDAFVKENYYIKLHKSVNEHCNRCWPRWRAALMRNYVGTPWAIVSLIAAAALLILTLIQTIFSILE